jgi:hypothetical protein
MSMPLRTYRAKESSLVRKVLILEYSFLEFKQYLKYFWRPQTMSAAAYVKNTLHISPSKISE